VFKLLSRSALYHSIPEDEVVSKQQFVLFRIFSYSGSLVCLGVFLKMVLSIHQPGIVPYFILALAVIMLANFFLVKTVAGLRKAYFVMLAAAFILLHIVSYTCGGIRTGGSLYFPAIILYAYMLLGRKAGISFGVASILHIIYSYFISTYTDWTSFSLFKNDINLINQDFLINAILTIFLIASQGNYLQSGKNVVIQRLSKSKKMLEDKNILLKEYAHNLEKTNKELVKFASVASHDLKAPLRAIGTLTGIIQEETGHLFNEDTHTNFNIIKNRVNRMEQLLDALLKYSKADREKEEETEIDLNILLEKIIAEYTNDSRVTIKLYQKFPVIFSETNKMYQVFSNLISNAVLFNDKSKIEVNISVRETDKEWHFSVQDNGPGIDVRFHEKIFVIFQTLQRRDELETMGVGLSIVKKIVEEMGGEICVASEVGKGSEFVFTLLKKNLVKVTNTKIFDRETISIN
jgi:signal transduction histidine kinase